MTQNITQKPLGGYAVTSVKEHETRNGVAFTAVITKDGKKIIGVQQDGNGGPNMYDLPGTFRTMEAAQKAMPAYRAAEAAFFAFAKEWAAGTDYAGFEEEDALTNHLMSIEHLNRKRAVVVLLDDDDYFDRGVYRTLGAKVTMDQALAALRTPQYASRNPRVWDKTKGEFVAVV